MWSACGLGMWPACGRLVVSECGRHVVGLWSRNVPACGRLWSALVGLWAGIRGYHAVHEPGKGVEAAAVRRLDRRLDRPVRDARRPPCARSRWRVRRRRSARAAIRRSVDPLGRRGRACGSGCVGWRCPRVGDGLAAGDSGGGASFFGSEVGWGRVPAGEDDSDGQPWHDRRWRCDRRRRDGAPGDSRWRVRWLWWVQWLQWLQWLWWLWGRVGWRWLRGVWRVFGVCWFWVWVWVGVWVGVWVWVALAESGSGTHARRHRGQGRDVGDQPGSGAGRSCRDTGRSGGRLGRGQPAPVGWAAGAGAARARLSGCGGVRALRAAASVRAAVVNAGA
jgi:hypothetical protein